MDKIKKDLQEKGYAIVENILSEEEIKEYTNEFHKWKTSVPKLDFFHKLGNPHCIYKYHQVGHQRHAWLVRTNKKVQDVFKSIWNTNDLVVSFDGCCYMSKNLKKKDNCWTHIDQGVKKQGLHCYQGFVALTSNKERTLLVYEGSHKLHNDYFKEMKITKHVDWNLIDQGYLKKIENKKRILEVPAGSLVLWDSRTFHQNRYGKPNSEERLIQYVSFLPKDNKKNSKSMQEKRRRYFNDKRTTSHWAYPIKVNGLQTKHYGNEKLIIDYDKLPKIELDDLMDDINKIL